jgi:hypothetical protein
MSGKSGEDVNRRIRKIVERPSSSAKLDVLVSF